MTINNSGFGSNYYQFKFPKSSNDEYELGTIVQNIKSEEGYAIETDTSHCDSDNCVDTSRYCDLITDGCESTDCDDQIN